MNLGLLERTFDFDARNFLLDSLGKNTVGMEIGVHKGAFTRRILERVQPKRLYIVDPWKYETSSEYKRSWYGGWMGGSQENMDRRHESILRRFDSSIKSGLIQVLRSYSKEALTGLPEGHLDWVYIDGNHKYEFVKEDLLHSMRTVRPGGLITGDDYGEGGWWEGGVKKAVDEFVRQNANIELVCIKKCQFILKNH